MATSNIPETMQALIYDRSDRSLKLNNSQPVPKPQFEKKEYLLKVRAAAITNGELNWAVAPKDWKDYSPGVEMSGIVVQAPSNPKFAVGSNVYMRTTFPRSGSARDYTIALEYELSSKPRNMSAEQAAAIPVSALTAWQALFVKAGYEPILDGSQFSIPAEKRKRILIIGASGAVGIWATQLAYAAGFLIVGTCHTRNVDMVRAFGAHEAMDYTKMSVRQWIDDRDQADKFDLVLDCATDGSSFDSWYAVRPHGLYMSIVPPADSNYKWTLPRPEGIDDTVKGIFFIMKSDGEQLDKITELIEAGKAKPVVDSVFELEDYQEAFDRVDSGKASGKVVLRVGGHKGAIESRI